MFLCLRAWVIEIPIAGPLALWGEASAPRLARATDPRLERACAKRAQSYKFKRTDRAGVYLSDAVRCARCLDFVDVLLRAGVGWGDDFVHSSGKTP